MVKDDSNKSDSMTIAGILVTVGIIAIFVAFALGVMEPNIFFDNDVQPANAGTPSASENSVSEYTSENIPETSPGSGDVPVAQKCELGPYNTTAGSIEIIDYNFPYLTEDLPLCITNEMAQEWYVTVSVKGGYVPLDTVGMWPMYGITVWQDQDKDGVRERIQGWNIDWIDLGDDPDCDCCSCNIWNGTVAWCDNKVCLDSNRWPIICDTTNIPGIDCDMILPRGASDIIPGKDVIIKVNTKWEGCRLTEQQFAIILVHKNHIPGIPNSRINI